MIRYCSSGVWAILWISGGNTGISDIYLNGCFLKHNEGGYVSFEVDITDLARFDQENVLSVYVNPDSYETWWYEGGGIYRNVWLVKTDMVAVDLWGVFLPVRKLQDTLWQVPVEVEIRNDDYQDEAVQVECDLRDPDGQSVTVLSMNGVAKSRDIVKLSAGTTIRDPQLWDIDSPKQYTAIVTIRKNVNGESVNSPLQNHHITNSKLLLAIEKKWRCKCFNADHMICFLTIK